MTRLPARIFHTRGDSTKTFPLCQYPNRHILQPLPHEISCEAAPRSLTSTAPPAIAPTTPPRNARPASPTIPAQAGIHPPPIPPAHPRIKYSAGVVTKKGRLRHCGESRNPVPPSQPSPTRGEGAILSPLMGESQRGGDPSVIPSHCHSERPHLRPFPRRQESIPPSPWTPAEPAPYPDTGQEWSKKPPPPPPLSF